MSAVGSYAISGAVTGSVVGGVIGVLVAPIAGFAFQLAIEIVGIKKLQNKNSLWDKPYVITPLACGIAGAAIGIVTSVARYYLFS